MKLKSKLAVLLAVVAALSFCTVSCGTGDGTTVMKLGGFNVRYDVYMFAVRTERAALESKYGADAFNGDVSPELVEELKTGAVAYLRNVYSVLSLAADYGISISDAAIENDAKEQREADEEEVGGKDEFLSMLREQGMTEAVYTFLTQVGAVGDELYYAMLNSGAINTDPEFVRSVIEGDGCVRVKHILITNDKRSDEDARSRAETVRSLAEGGADFDELVREYSEDPRMFSNPQGYYMFRGIWYRAFEDASFALEIGELSDVFETPSGFSVVKRYEKDPDFIADNFDDLADDYYDSEFSLAREKRAGELEITDSDKCDKIDVLGA